MPATAKSRPIPDAATRERVANLFHALSDPTRLHLVELAQSRLSFHLKALKDAGLVADRKDGRWVHYRLRPEALEEIASALQLVRQARPGAWRSITCC